MRRYGDGVALVLGIARIEARAGRAAQVEPGHLLLGLSKLCGADLGVPATLPRKAVETDAAALRGCFERAGVDPDRLRRRLRRALASSDAGPSRDHDRDAGRDGAEPARDHDRDAGRGGAEPAAGPPPGGAVPHRDRGARRAFARAGELAGDEPAGAVALLRAVLESPTPPCREVFDRLGVPDPLSAFFPGTPDTPFLDRYGRDLTRLAREDRLPPLIGRRGELLALARALVQQRKANPVLVGEAGVGKTGIVEGLAHLLAQPDAPKPLAGARIVELTMSALVAGTKYRGELEERMLAVLGEARDTPGLILFIDEVHTVLTAADILKPALARGEVRCIGATTPAEYRRSIEQDPALRRRFQLVRVEEPTRTEAVEILEGLRGRLAGQHGVEIAGGVPAAAVDLALRYLPELRLPDKAIDLVDQACAAARIRTLSPDDTKPLFVGPDEIAAAVAERAGLPVQRVTAGEAERLLGLEEDLRRRVVGQQEAVAAVADAIRTARAGLGDPRRPVGVFLFAGPTGTGKTELAKALAEALFDDERRLIRIDMSEYQERHAVSRLLGAPPGYVGHDRDGQLSGPLRDHPHSVVLFDEVEKAHPEVLDVFLQIFDEGQLTDAQGRRVSFTETVVILTTNLGSERGEPAGFNAAAAAPQVMAALRRHLRPELLGRIGRVVVFDPLTERELRRVAAKLVERVAARLTGRAVTLDLTDAAYDLLVGRAVAERSGARALEQAVDRLLVVPLGRALLTGRVQDGAAVRVDAAGEELAWTTR
ncbi:ATP-dependent Clp protease ATP-binding subunit [Dactylosporangium sp. AC04546]|uniref:AAA family ATPase n=1 Tax=Dactylosporangium sp. AC04546 TaxID=2862460 RepID=UPI001EDCC264|nr:ATP-dependent Clp protease ATP-binding subunit [Dactylosporangium sp. AC04546]WVK88428.1 ATP-dependent Clp protease ATP-binding subunit [Dactylosporangium sp. AC04546]